MDGTRNDGAPNATKDSVSERKPGKQQTASSRKFHPDLADDEGMDQSFAVGINALSLSSSTERDRMVNVGVERSQINSNNSLDTANSFAESEVSPLGSVMVAEKQKKLVHTGKNHCIYRYGSQKGKGQALALKIMRNTNPTKEQSDRFYHECEILEYLANTDCRSAIQRSMKRGTITSNGHLVQYLEWVEGVTLQEWIRVSYQKNERKTEQFICMAMEIGKALNKLHSAGVLHNKFSTQNIIVQEVHCNMFSVKIIDLASATLRTDRTDSSHSGSWKIADLRALGVVLYEILTGEQTFGNMEEDYTNSKESSSGTCGASSKKMRGKSPSSKSKIPGMSHIEIPIYLNSMISNLLLEDDTQVCYSSAADVVRDLERSLKDPDRFLCIPDAQQLQGQLNAPHGRLYGRDSQMSMLMYAYHSCEAVLISGHSGTGKSFLVNHIREPLEARGGHFIQGKFNQLQQAEPLSAVATAFNQFCDIFHERNDAAALHQIRKAMFENVGANSKILTNLIPSLGKIIGETDDSGPTKIFGAEALNHFHFCFTEFVRCISTSEHPVVLFLDDLQWADVASLSLISALITETQNTPFLFIGCYRDDEVTSQHPLSLHFQDLKNSDTRIVEIKVGNLDRESVCALVVDTLCLPPCIAMTFARVIYSKTGGNPLFVVQFLEAIFKEGLLRFSLATRRWEWDTETISSKNIADNVVNLMRRKILCLSEDVQTALTMFAFLGFQCEASILELFEMDSSGDVINIVPSLAAAATEGCIYRDGTRWKFAHDEIQRAVYSSVPETQRDALHLWLGRKILDKATGIQLAGALFLVIDQLNRGSNLITEGKERLELARLNLTAGKKAMAASAFLSASSYLEKGISLLETGHWEANNDLMLSLFDNYAEALYTLGSFSEMKEAIEQVLCSAKSFKDKSHVYRILMTAEFSKNEHENAIETGLFVLAQLGEPFPSNVDDSIVQGEVSKTLDTLEGRAASSLSGMKEMKNENKIEAMKFLGDMFGYLQRMPRTLILVSCRMVQLSLLHGVCRESAIGFALFGRVLCGPIGNIEKGYQLGKVALSLLDRFSARQCLAKVYWLVFCEINCWAEPFQLEKLQFAVQAGIQTGDILGVVLCAGYLPSCQLQSGEALPCVLMHINQHVKLCQKYKNEVALVGIKPYWQVVLNLMGESKDPCKLTGKAMHEDIFLTFAHEKKKWGVICFVHLFRMWLAYLFGRYELAGEMAEKSRDIYRVMPTFSTVGLHAFYDGLVSLVHFRKTKQEKWQILANHAMTKVKGWSQSASWYFENKIELMSAEYHYSLGDLDKAKKSFDEAIDIAHRNGFTHEEALASERAGIFCLETSEYGNATKYFSLSIQCYKKWGATAKVDHLNQCLVQALTPPNSDV